MKKLLLAIGFLLTTATASFAQKGPDNDKIKALYIAYITEQLTITSAEAQSFWPVYAQYENELKMIPTSDVLGSQQKILDVKKKYQDKFSKILGAERTNTFYLKDGEFRKRMIDRLRTMRQQTNGPKPGKKNGF